MDSLLSFALSVQIVLAILAPGIPINGRNLFLSDLWVFVSFFVMALESRWIGWRPDRKLIRRLFSLVALFGILYVHGKARGEFPPGFENLYAIGTLESSQFNPEHEFVMAFRYLSWIVEGVWLWSLLEKMDADRRSDLQKAMFKALSGIVVSAAGLTIMCGLSSSFSEFLAGIYGYAADEMKTWAGRGFGPFRTPFEAALTLAPSGLLILSFFPDSVPDRLFRKGALLLTALGTLVSRSMISISAIVVAWFLTRVGTMKARVRVLTVVAVAFVISVLFVAAPQFVAAKTWDLAHHLGPWQMFLGMMVSRWDMILLGFGFHPVNVDNAYIFMLFKFGIVGSAALGFWAVRWGRKYWSYWTSSQREVILFLLISGLALDTFIIRPLVMVFIAAGLPLLYPNRSVE